MSILIKDMKIPQRGMVVNIYADGRVTNHFDEFGKTIGKAVSVPPHGRCVHCKHGWYLTELARKQYSKEYEDLKQAEYKKINDSLKEGK